jgi:hypothetical protein
MALAATRAELQRPDLEQLRSGGGGEWIWNMRGGAGAAAGAAGSGAGVGAAGSGAGVGAAGSRAGTFRRATIVQPAWNARVKK